MGKYSIVISTQNPSIKHLQAFRKFKTEKSSTMKHMNATYGQNFTLLKFPYSSRTEKHLFEIYPSL